MNHQRIFVAGHRGMVGAAVLRQLEAQQAAGRKVEIITRTKAELDLCEQSAVRDFFASERPDGVIVAAAKVGGILANNTYPADFITQNLWIETNVIDAAYRSGAQRLLFLGSSCIYPKLCTQPITEDMLLTGALEPTNEPYALAKIAGIKLCESYNRQYGTDFRSVMPTNLYGPGDNFHPEHSHVLPGMLRRFHEAQLAGADSVTIWGTGTPRREFLHVDDMASACLHVFDLPVETYRAHTGTMLSQVNVGTGSDVSILELAQAIAGIVGFTGEIRTDTTKPDGTPRKLLDVSLLERLGWKARIGLEEGIAQTYRWFLDHAAELRAT